MRAYGKIIAQMLLSGNVMRVYVDISHSLDMSLIKVFKINTFRNQ